MKDGPTIAGLAALVGDPARANMLVALMDGRALTVSELAETAGVTLATASGHLSKLEDAGLIAAEKQGRHRYIRLTGPDVAALLESLMSLAQRTGAVRVRTGPRDAALREARICYDHLAGDLGVAMFDSMVRRRLIDDADDLQLTEAGRSFADGLGIDVGVLAASRRPVCRRCLDWSVRRSHLAGGLGTALLRRFEELRWAKRVEGTRVVTFSPSGRAAFARTFELEAR